jgi:hypothetical protein
MLMISPSSYASNCGTSVSSSTRTFRHYMHAVPLQSNHREADAETFGEKNVMRDAHDAYGCGALWVVRPHYLIDRSMVHSPLSPVIAALAFDNLYFSDHFLCIFSRKHNHYITEWRFITRILLYMFRHKHLYELLEVCALCNALFRAPSHQAPARLGFSCISCLLL